MNITRIITKVKFKVKFIVWRFIKKLNRYGEKRWGMIS